MIDDSGGTTSREGAVDHLALPGYERPPVTEIIVAVQFLPVAKFGMPEALAVARALPDWRIADVPPALSPIVEPEPGRPQQPSFNFSLGTPPVRVLLESPDGRWLAQVQQDRVAVHERKGESGVRPSFANVRPELERFVCAVSVGVGRPILTGDHRPELVEVIYENPIPPGEGWEGFGRLDQVLRVLAKPQLPAPFAEIEQGAVGLTFVLRRQDAFAGRLHVSVNPAIDASGAPMLHLRLMSRRYVGDHDLDVVLEECHRDIVEGFTAMTTDAMHRYWGRQR